MNSGNDVCQGSAKRKMLVRINTASIRNRFTARREAHADYWEDPDIQANRPGECHLREDEAVVLRAWRDNLVWINRSIGCLPISSERRTRISEKRAWQLFSPNFHQGRSYRSNEHRLPTHARASIQTTNLILVARIVHEGWAGKSVQNKHFQLKTRNLTTW